MQQQLRESENDCIRPATSIDAQRTVSVTILAEWHRYVVSPMRFVIDSCGDESVPQEPHSPQGKRNA
jgi:hypothetical protein